MFTSLEMGCIHVVLSGRAGSQDLIILRHLRPIGLNILERIPWPFANEGMLSSHFHSNDIT
jgi:hypothetical protein